MPEPEPAQARLAHDGGQNGDRPGELGMCGERGGGGGTRRGGGEGGGGGGGGGRGHEHLDLHLALHELDGGPASSHEGHEHGGWYK